MKVLTLLSLIITLIVFGSYFYLIEPLLGDSSWLAFLVFMAIFLLLNYVQRRFDDGRMGFEFLQKRIDKQLSLFIVIFLLLLFVIAGLWF